MKPVLLINVPGFIEGKDITYGNITSPEYPPLNLGYLSSYLNEHKYKADMLDLNIEKKPKEKLLKILKSNTYSLIGLSITTPLFQNAKEIAKIIKEFDKNMPIVVGGIHPTISPTECIAFKNFDYVIEGEGEIALLKLVKGLEKKIKLSDIGGLSYKNGKKIIRNPFREKPVNLDSLPFPRRDFFLQHEYSYPDILVKPAMPIVTSRGCTGLCTYCCTKKIYKFMRLQSPDKIVDEIEFLINKFGVREIHIWDDCFSVSKKRVLDVCNSIIKRNLKIKIAFPNGVRADTIDYDILKALKKAGAYSIAFGVESGNERILKKIKKGMTKKQIAKAFKISKKVGLETWAFLMIGLPGEDKETINDTIKFAKELNPDIVKYNFLMPFPGTEAFMDLNSKGLIKEKNFSKYGFHGEPVHELETLSKEDLIKLYKKAYKEFYFRPLIILKQLTRIKSWTRFKINIKTGIDVIKLVLKRDLT